MKLPTITDVAHQLGKSPRRTFKALREFDLIGSNNLARSMYVDLGYFAIETREWRTPGGTVRHQYRITTVTAKGFALIQDILDGRAPAVPAMQGLRTRDGNPARTN